MTTNDLPPLWRDHYEESVAVGIEGGGNEAFIRRERLAVVLEQMREEAEHDRNRARRPAVRPA